MVRKIFLMFFCTLSVVCLHNRKRLMCEAVSSMRMTNRPLVQLLCWKVLTMSASLRMSTVNSLLRLLWGGQLIISYLGYKLVEVPVQHI